jgi:glycosyltransferase involved in cell wall biosynthesis
VNAARPRLVIFSDDWGRHPSSSQHLVRHLLERWDVDWINTIGTRRPSLKPADLKRALGKLRAWTRPAAAANSDTAQPAHLCVHAPLHWPGFTHAWERKLNARIFEQKLGALVRNAAAVVTTASITADLAARTHDANWIYYCVDDLSEWPGLDAHALRAMELDLLPHMRRVVAVSEPLRARLRALGRDSELLTHGIELDHWALPRARGPRARQAMPLALYWGHADRRLDAEICLKVAESARLVMVGPRTDVDPRLVEHARIEWRAPLPYSELPRLALEADVLVMPYADLAVTRAMQPLKLKEYLATGLPVVAGALPANLEWSDALDATFDPARFAALVRERAFAPLPRAQAVARERLVGESWASKARELERCLRGGGT